MRILAVDDDPTVRELVRTTLACAGYPDVVSAPSAMAALMQVARAAEPFECFLLDVQMPGTDGIELCRQIRRIEAHRDTPILMITAVTDRDAVESAFAAGATDYVSKPFDALELIVRIGMAERLCAQEAEARRTREQIDYLRARFGADDRPGLDEPFGIVGVPTLVRPVEMENYLLRLPRLRAWRSRTYTLRIEDVAAIHAALSGEDFYDLMAEVGDAIAAVLKPWPHIITYAGAGTFACVVHGPYRPRPEALLAEARAQVLARGLEAGGRPLDLSVEGEAPVGALLAVLEERSQLARA